MFYNNSMDSFEKLKIFEDNLEVDDGFHLYNSSETFDFKKTGKQIPNVTSAKLPGGGSIPLLKTMVSSICEKDCNYCCFRSGRDIPRAMFQPDELAKCFIQMEKKNVVQGLFLSSGILGRGVFSQDKIIETAEILRIKYKFQGYLHLKVMLGAEKDQIRQLMMYADRVSINLEAPNPDRLKFLAPQKKYFEEIINCLKWIQEIRTSESSSKNFKNQWSSVSTQFVVGPAKESDAEIINASSDLFNRFNLSRVYFMAFSPVINTPFENIAPENPVREKRLYQASFLIRDYGFQMEDFYFDWVGNMSLTKDPKTFWAEKNLLESPLEINKASKEELLRVPGIGIKKANNIIVFRQKNRIRNLDHLNNMGISYEKSGKYILVDGKILEKQLSLFTF